MVCGIPPVRARGFDVESALNRSAAVGRASGTLLRMRLLVYEWCTSGGLAGGQAAIAAEGRMMIEALAADVAKDPGLDLTVLVEDGRACALPPSACRLNVSPGDEVTMLVAAARAADWTLVVAPESDGILCDRVRAVRGAAGRPLAAGPDVLALAADKQATIDTLAARGLPVPAGRSLAGGEAIPQGFRLPAIRKARGGCGCEHLEILHAHDHAVAAVPTRLEALAEGTPVGVSLICGPRMAIPLPVMRQEFSGGDGPAYLGGGPLLDAAAADRATELAVRAAAALGADAGWLGVDLILGHRADGREDRILEINPRVTTSFVGQASLFASSLVRAMIDAAGGTVPGLAAIPRRSGEQGSFRVPHPPRVP